MNVIEKVQYKLTETFGRLPQVFTAETRFEGCNICGSHQLLTTTPKVKADFKRGIVPDALHKKLFQPTDAFCTICGHYQRLDRLSRAELDEYLAAVQSKDETVGEEAYHSLPVPADFIAGFEANHFDQRVARWDAFLSSAGMLKGGRALVLRPFFGKSAGFFLENGYQVDAMEISRVARVTTEERHPSVKFLEGNIHHRLSGEFLSDGPYDAIAVYHVLQHCADPIGEIRKLGKMLAPGGFMIFSAEIGRKPHNPFHMNHFSERGLLRVLADLFPNVQTIRDCETSPPEFIAAFTIEGDEPDIVVTL